MSLNLRVTASVLAMIGAASGCFVACTSDATSEDPGAAGPDASASPRPEGTSPSDAGAPVRVQLLAINDFHGNLEPPTGSGGTVLVPLGDALADAGADSGVLANPDAGTALVPAGGAAHLATHIKSLRAENPNTIVVSAGDLTGASPLLSNLFRDEPAVLVMNQIGLDFEGVGNHEFDRGLTELKRLQNGGCSLGDCDAGLGNFAGAKFKYLAANVDETATNQTVFPPYAVKELAGVKIAFIGMTLQGTPTTTTAAAVQGLSFQSEVDTVNALLPEIQKQGVSAVVVLLHQGAFQGPTGTYDSCESLTGDLLPILEGDPDGGHPGLSPAVDVVVSAHTHQAYDCMIDGRLVTSAASFGRIVTKIDLTIDPSAKRVVDKKAHNVPVTRDVAPDPDVAGIVATFQSKAAPLANRVIGYISADLTANPLSIGSASCESPLGDVIADAQLAATSAPANGGAQIAFMNPGGIRTDLVFKGSNKPNGTVTYGEAFAVQPFANTLVTMSLTGAQIVEALKAQFAGAAPKVLQASKGFTYTYAWNAATRTLTLDPASVKLDGAPLEVAKTYRVTVNAFLAGGGDAFGVFKAGTDRLSGGVDLDAVAAYLTATSTPAAPLAPPPLSRISGNGCAP